VAAVVAAAAAVVVDHQLSVTMRSRFERGKKLEERNPFFPLYLHYYLCVVYVIIVDDLVEERQRHGLPSFFEGEGIWSIQSIMSGIGEVESLQPFDCWKLPWKT